VNKHLYFRSEESDFSDFSDSVANQKEQAEKNLKVGQKQRQRRKKVKDGEQLGMSYKPPLEVNCKDKRGGTRGRKKEDLETTKLSIDTEGSRTIRSHFQEDQEAYDSEDEEWKEVGSVAKKEGVATVAVRRSNSSSSFGLKMIIARNQQEKQRDMSSVKLIDHIKELKQSKLFGIKNQVGFSFILEDEEAMNMKGVAGKANQAGNASIGGIKGDQR